MVAAIWQRSALQGYIDLERAKPRGGAVPLCGDDFHWELFIIVVFSPLAVVMTLGINRNLMCLLRRLALLCLALRRSSAVVLCSA